MLSTPRLRYLTTQPYTLAPGSSQLLALLCACRLPAQHDTVHKECTDMLDMAYSTLNCHPGCGESFRKKDVRIRGQAGPRSMVGPSGVGGGWG